MSNTFCRSALQSLKERAEAFANEHQSLHHMVVLPKGEFIRIPMLGCHPVGFGNSPPGPFEFGDAFVSTELPPPACWPKGLEPATAIVAVQEYVPYEHNGREPYRAHLFFGDSEYFGEFESLARDIVNLRRELLIAICGEEHSELGEVLYSSGDTIHGERERLLDEWLCTMHWWAWKVIDSPIHTSPRIVFNEQGIAADFMDEAVPGKLSYSLLPTNIFKATQATIDTFLRFLKVPPFIAWPEVYPPVETDQSSDALVEKRTETARTNEGNVEKLPTAFISYSWDDDNHKNWVRELAARLRSHGVKVILDQWETAPGDQLPQFMETAIRENDFILIICTQNYKHKSDLRKGGAGYEGHVMTAELFTKQEQRKFIPILRGNDRANSTPTWLEGKYSIDLSGDPYSENEYNKLVSNIHDIRDEAPPIGEPPNLIRLSNAHSTGFQQKQLVESLTQKGNTSWNRFQQHRSKIHLPRSIGGYRWTAIEVAGNMPEINLDREFMYYLQTKQPQPTGFPPWSFVDSKSPSLNPSYEPSLEIWEALYFEPKFCLLEYWQLAATGYLFDVAAFEDDFSHENGQSRVFHVFKQIDRVAETIWVANSLLKAMNAPEDSDIQYVFYWHHLKNRVAVPNFRGVNKSNASHSYTDVSVPLGIAPRDTWQFVKKATQRMLLSFDGLSVGDDQYQEIVGNRILDSD